MVFQKARGQTLRFAAYIRSPPDDCKTSKGRKARKISVLATDEARSAGNVVSFLTGVKRTPASASEKNIEKGCPVGAGLPPAADIGRRNKLAVHRDGVRVAVRHRRADIGRTLFDAERA